MSAQSNEWAEVLRVLDLGVHTSPAPEEMEPHVRLIAPGTGDGMSEPVTAGRWTSARRGPGPIRTVA